MRWQMAYFYVFCSKNILTELFGYQQPTCLCIKMEFFHVYCMHFRSAVFVRVGQPQLCTGNSVSFYMCSAVEVAWLAHNIRHSQRWIKAARGLKHIKNAGPQIKDTL